jgi:hypothetical protein
LSCRLLISPECAVIGVLVRLKPDSKEVVPVEMR